MPGLAGRGGGRTGAVGGRSNAPTGGRRLAVLALVATMAIWGSSFVVTCLRFGLRRPVLLPFAYRRGFRLRLVLEPAFLLFGLTGVALVYGLQTMALVFTSAANTALISTGMPVAAVLARVSLEERIPPARPLGVGLSVLGVPQCVSSVAFLVKAVRNGPGRLDRGRVAAR